MRPSKERLLELVAFVEPGSDDVTYTHAVFAQCFLPIRKLRGGRHALRGAARPRGAPHRSRRSPQPCDAAVRADGRAARGSAARIVLAHINNHLIRAKTVEEALLMPMGESLRDFMDYQGLSIGGKNGKEITRQNNLAAARIVLGVWTDTHARQVNTQIADSIDFWLERDRRQRTLWQPLMRVSERYAQAIRWHCVPHDIRALVGLYENTRAMDIYTWLAYRLPKVASRAEVFVRFGDLKPIFGTGIRDGYKFRQAFKGALTEALRWYPLGRVSLEREGIRLFHSPSPVPIDLSRSPYGRTIAGGRRRLRLVKQ